jgi:N-acetylglucosaminyldiphosphoundecaprenol N-acetyl-beta-D-mannosaminyltransferase
MSRIQFLDVPIDLLSMREAVELASDSMRRRVPRRHVALNVAKFVKMRGDAELRRDVVESDIIGIDGMGIVVGLKLFGCHRAQRVPGIDLMEGLLERCAAEGLCPFVLGARREVLERAVAVARQRWPGLVFAGWRDGYFTAGEEPAVVAEIARARADCLLVAMPTPRKERFLGHHGAALDVPFIMGVGGSIDVLAGLVRRAPGWMQRTGLEWLYRLLQEPRRMLWRYASTNTQFAFILVRALVARVTGHPAIRYEPS